MSGGPPEVTTPPEVPDEFAAAYREAYERALLEQTDAPRHRFPPHDQARQVDPTPPSFETVAARPPQEPGAETVAARPPQEPGVETVAARPPQEPGAETVAARPPQEPGVEGPPADVELPERRGRLVVGTHRQEAVLDTGDTWFDHVRDSRLFVPVLLTALALLLVLGAYVLGRAFTAAVGG